MKELEIKIKEICKKYELTTFPNEAFKEDMKEFAMMEGEDEE